MKHVWWVGVVAACGAEVEPEQAIGAYSEQAQVIDFGLGEEDGWVAINDTVMGGVSQADLTFDEGSMVFEGAVSTDSNGGFSSVRSPAASTDLSGFDRVVLRLRSEGQPFSLVIADEPLFFQPQFKVDLEVPDDGWHTLSIPFTEFGEVAFSGGYPEPTGMRLTAEDLADVDHFEFISELFVDGPFRLEVDWVAFDLAE
jgi:NADH dehydrogenase [ubiquinone] 1 alpha subcomplex assembly factor 1